MGQPAESIIEAEGGTINVGRGVLGRTLADRFAVYEKDRRSAEQQWMTNLRQMLGKYDPDIEQNLPANFSRAYPKITRVKVVSMVSRLMALLFPAGEKNWGVEASPVPNLPAETLSDALDEWRQLNPGVEPTPSQLEQLVKKVAAEIAKLQETVIDDQLKDINSNGAGDYESLVRRVVFSGVLYGPGILKGPMTLQETSTGYQIDAAGMIQIVEQTAYRPYYEFVPCWDYYPDMSAAEFDQMEGEFQRHVYNKHRLMELAKRSDFDGDAIRKYVAGEPGGNYQKSNHETELQTLASSNTDAASKSCKYQVLEYWGSADAKTLRAAGLELDDRVGADDIVPYSAWVLDGYIVKLSRNPFPVGTKVFHQFVFEEDEVNLMGSGLPPIMRDSQLAVSSAARMLIDNASAVCGPNVEVNVERLSPTMTDLSIRPFKVWQVEDSGSGGGSSRAINDVSFESHITELLSIVNTFRSFADAETFVSPLTGGDLEGVPGEALRTTGGASMAYGNAALPFRDIVRNFDRFTVGVIDSLVQWNRIFYVDRDKLAGDVRPIPKGATSLMAKEMRAFALDNLANSLSADEMIYLDSEALLKQRLMVRDLPLAELMADEEEVKRRKESQAQQAQTAQQQASEMFAAELQNLRSDSLKQMAQAQKHLDTADVQVLRALLDAIEKGTDPNELARIARSTRQGSSEQQGNPVAVPARQVPGGGDQ